MICPFLVAYGFRQGLSGSGFNSGMNQVPTQNFISWQLHTKKLEQSLKWEFEGLKTSKETTSSCWTDSLLIQHLCAFKSAFRTNCAWHSSLEIWVLDFVKIACTLICECLKIFLMISLSALLTWMKAGGWKKNINFFVMFLSQDERHNPHYLCNVLNEWECIFFLFCREL